MVDMTQNTNRTTHLLALMKKGDDAFNSRDFAAMDAGRHPDMIAHITGSDKPTHGRAAHAAVQQAMFRAFPDVHLHNDPYPIHFGDGDWMTMVCKITGTFTGEMALPDGKTIPGTGKSFEVDFSRAARWEGDHLIEEWVSWDSALMNQQLGIASTEAGNEPTPPAPDTKAAPLDTRLFRHSPAYTLDRATAPAMWLVGSLWLIQATGIQTNNRCSFLEQVMPSGLGPPTHRHPVSIEGFYIVEGTMNFHVQGRIVRAEAGTLIHLPRMIPHTFTVESEEARVINWYAPAGNEIQVVSLAHPAEERRRPTMEESATSKNDELNQILSRLYGSVAVTALPFSVPPAEDLVVTEPGSWCAGTLKMARAEDGPAFQAFGLAWHLLAAGSETGDDYDLFEVVAAAGSGMPRRIIGTDEAIYVLEGSLTVESDGKSVTTGVGAFSYAPAGTLLRWQAAGAARLLVFHFPGGFDRALAGGRGQEALVVAWLESTGTRFIDAMPVTPAIPGAPAGS